MPLRPLYTSARLCLQLVITALLFANLGLCASSDGTPAAGVSATQASFQKQQDSLAAQRQSLQRQYRDKAVAMESTDDFISPFPPLPQMDCAPLSTDEISALIESASKKTSLQPEVLHAVMKQESAFKPCAVSAKGAQGLMQLMPSTVDLLHVADPFDPTQNVAAGAAFLKQLLDKYKGDLRLALVAYNAGPNRAGAPESNSFPDETQQYIANIFAELGSQTSKAPATEPPK